MKLDQDSVYVNAINLTELFNNTDSEKLQPQDCSFLDPHNIYQGAKLIKAMFDVCNEVSSVDMIELVSFKPHRILLQEIAAQFTVYIVIHGEDSDKKKRNGHIESIYRSIISNTTENEAFYKKYHPLFDKLEKNYTAQLFEPKNNRSVEILKERNKTKPFFVSRKLVRYEGFVHQDLSVSLATAKQYNLQAREAIRDYAYNKIVTYLKLKSSLSFRQTLVKRKSLFIVGGPGSGKGTLTNKLLKQNDDGNFVEINTDSYKSLFMSVPLTPKLILSYSQLVQFEAAFVRRIVLSLARAKGMHTLIDQVYLGEDILEESNTSFVEGVIVSTKIKSAINRAVNRALDYGRFEATQSIIRNHREMLIKAIKSIKILLTAEAPKNIKIHFYDNSIDGEQERLFMMIDFSTTPKNVTIIDFELLVACFSKMYVNNTNSPSEVLIDEDNAQIRQQALVELNDFMTIVNSYKTIEAHLQTLMIDSALRTVNVNINSIRKLTELQWSKENILALNKILTLKKENLFFCNSAIKALAKLNIPNDRLFSVISALLSKVTHDAWSIREAAIYALLSLNLSHIPTIPREVSTAIQALVPLLHSNYWGIHLAGTRETVDNALEMPMIQDAQLEIFISFFAAHTCVNKTILLIEKNSQMVSQTNSSGILLLDVVMNLPNEHSEKNNAIRVLLLNKANCSKSYVGKILAYAGILYQQYPEDKSNLESAIRSIAKGHNLSLDDDETCSGSGEDQGNELSASSIIPDQKKCINSLCFVEPTEMEVWKNECREIQSQENDDVHKNAIGLCHSIFTEKSPIRIDYTKQLCALAPVESTPAWQPTFFNRFCSWLTTSNGFQKIADSESAMPDLVKK